MADVPAALETRCSQAGRKSSSGSRTEVPTRYPMGCGSRSIPSHRVFIAGTVDEWK